jgi:hypothetical protein
MLSNTSTAKVPLGFLRRRSGFCNAPGKTGSDRQAAAHAGRPAFWGSTAAALFFAADLADWARHQWQPDASAAFYSIGASAGIRAARWPSLARSRH